jgi:hypothetical protein
MITTRGFTAASCSSQRISNCSASGANSRRSVSSAAVASTPSASCSKCTRMKNSPLRLSPNCAESRMLLLRSNRKPETAWTMPCRSGHDSFKIKL